LLNKVVEIPVFNATIQGNYDCTPVLPINKTIQSNFNGFRICGFRNGDVFTNATRPNYFTQECPEGTLPCSLKTSVENTICYPIDQLESKCPITDIQFYPSSLRESLKRNKDLTV